MKPFKLWMLVALLGIAACSDAPTDDPLAPSEPELTPGGSGTVRVRNSSDDGPGSFRAAVEAANASASIREIQFATGLSPILLEEPVVYTGPQSLAVRGGQAVIDGAGLAPTAAAAFLVTGGGDLAIAGLTLRNAPQQGLAVEVPSDAGGVRKVALVDVKALGNQGHGVLINDQVDPEDTADPAGSDASLEVTVIGSRFADNGFGALDRDGLRVNEGGNGGLTVVLALSRAEGNGADGVELDERGPGDVRFGVSASQFTGNGSFDQTLTDLDDGFDVDESNEGSLIGTVVLSSANDNQEEGFDFNENHEGDFRIDMTLVEASRNLEEGIDFEEDDDFQGGGDLVTALAGIKANDNGSTDGDGGIKIRERGDGDIDATVRGAETAGNSVSGISIREQQTGSLAARIERASATGNVTGIAVREDDDGSLAATVDRSTTDGNTSHGIDFDENSTGDLTATASNGRSSSNGGAGVRADQQTAGAGTLDLIAMTFGNNSLGDYLANGTVTVTP